MGDAERMISVAELLRREGVGASEQPRKRGRVAATAAGVVALCGAAATGIVGFAPPLSMSQHLGDDEGAVQQDGSSDGGGVALGGEDRTSGSDGDSPFVRTSTQRTATSDDAERRVPAMTWLSDDVASDRTSSQWPTVDQDDAPGGAGSDRGEREPRTTSANRQHDTGGAEDDGARSQSEETGSRGGHDGTEGSQHGHGDADNGGTDSGGSGDAEGDSAHGGAEDGQGGEESGGQKSGQSGQASEGGGNAEDQGNAEGRGDAPEDRGNAPEDRGASEQRGSQPDERGKSHERGQSGEHGQGSANSGGPKHAD